MLKKREKENAIYGEGFVNDRTCLRWFLMFRAVDFSKDKVYSWGDHEKNFL